MKKKGFTLVELLAVIIILAVLALITMPIVFDIVDSAKKSAWESSARGILDAVQLNSVKNVTLGKSMEAVYDFPTTSFRIQGEQPKGGQVSVDKYGNVEMAIHNEKWCAVKKYKDADVTIIDYIEGECTLNLVGPETDYAVGTLVKIEVGTNVIHNFYILEDNGTTVTAIMDRNLGDDIALGNTGDTTPTIAEAYLNNYITQVENWNNISTSNVRLPDSIDIISQTKWYQGLDETQKENWKEEYANYVGDISDLSSCDTNATCRQDLENLNLGDILVPTWLDINLHTSGYTKDGDENKYAYWTSDIDQNGSDVAAMVYCLGFMSSFDITGSSFAGVRPVITINREHIKEILLKSEYINPDSVYYASGRLLEIEVGKNIKHNFYVLEDNGETVTAIMDRNLGDNTSWGQEADTTATIAEAYLNNYTSTKENWNNVTSKRLPNSLELISKTKWYNKLTDEDKANWENLYRTYWISKTSADECSDCDTNRKVRVWWEKLEIDDALLPLWLDINLYTSGDNNKDSNGDYKTGYWTSNLFSSDNTAQLAWSVSNWGRMNEQIFKTNEIYNGVRPVITIDKDYITKELSDYKYVNTSFKR